jgi:class 3 adenylate cyclase
MLDAIAAFLNRTYHDLHADRVLATVLSARVQTAAGHAAHDDAFDAHVRREIDWFRGRALDVSDTSYTAAFDGPARAIRCAASIAASSSRFGRAVRLGLHTGECDVDGAGLRGPAVDVASALGAQAAPGEVLVSRTVKDLVAGSGLSFADRGMEQLGDEGQRWRVFAAHVQGSPPP